MANLMHDLPSDDEDVFGDDADEMMDDFALPTKDLFSQKVLSNAKECLEHAKKEHGLDFKVSYVQYPLFCTMIS